MLPPGLSSSGSNSGSHNSNYDSDGDIDKYGLKGLNALTRMEQTDQTAFAIGQDINLLGLDFSEEKILPKLASPWAETARSEVEPYFCIPSSIQKDNIVPPPEPCDQKIQLFSDETLFYIFYMRPRDKLQEFAARELVARNWRYHKDIQVWLTKDSHVEAIMITQDVEKGVYIFFDPHNWEKIKKEFVLHYSSIQA